MSTKITALPASTGLVLSDIFPLVDDPSGVPVTQRATFTQLSTLYGIIHVPTSNRTFGGGAGNPSSTAIADTGFGVGALTTTIGGNNTAVGFEALLNNIGTSNTAVGRTALRANTTGFGNVAVGRDAMLSNIGGSANTAIGRTALQNNTTGIANVAIGQAALLSNVSSSNNTAVGHSALTSSTGAQNTAVGIFSLFNLTTGVNNTAIGISSGVGITTGNSNTILGPATGLAAGLSNNIILADGAGNQRLTIGSTGVVSIPIALTLAAGAPLSMASGANQRAGNAVLVAGTVTVANTTVSATIVVILTRKTAGGTLGNLTYTVVAGVSFTINSDSATDTSTVSYMLLGNL